MTTVRRGKCADGAACLALCACAFLTVLRFCAGTSPLRPDEYLWDSALFQAVGKLWADGMVPYRDIFDHKGPLLFLVQRIAYAFAQPRVALYVLESLSVSVSLCCCYAALRLKLKPLAALAGTLAALVFWLPLMEYGNLCETYSMPFLMLALLLQLKYLYGDRKTHPCGYALVYGLCFGANLMIRANNGLLIALVTLAVTLQLLERKQWKNVALNALALTAGVAAAVLPFAAYFARQGALDAFVYATWTFNLIYAESLEMALVMQNLRNVLFFITPALLCLFMGVLCLLRRKWTLALAQLLSALGTLYITLSGIGYTHYFMLHVPLIPLAFTAACTLADGAGWKRLMALACAAFALLAVRTTLPLAKAGWVSGPTPKETAQEEAFDEVIAQIAAAIPAQEHDSVAMCGLLVTDAKLILKTDLHPMGRYCFLMEWHSRADRSILNGYVAFLRSREAGWVLLRQEGISNQSVLDAIAECYTLHSVYALEDANYLLYCLN